MFTQYIKLDEKKLLKNVIPFWESHCIDREFGGIYYFMDALGKPHLELQADMKLWWVHNEATIACLYAYKMTGDAEFFDWFQRLDEWSWKHFPDPQYGEWFAYLNRHGEPTHMLKGGKWKTFFHLPRCLMVSLQLMKGMETRKNVIGQNQRCKSF